MSLTTPLRLPPLSRLPTQNAKADLYALLQTANILENIFARGDVSDTDYTAACKRLIAQYKGMRETWKKEWGEYGMVTEEIGSTFPAAMNRLVRIGVPATVEHASQGGGNGNDSRYVAETVSHLITLMDALKLNMAAVDQMHPLLSDLLVSIGKVSGLPNDFEGKVKVKEWLVVLNGMRASDELSEDQTRQLLFDLESAHAAFYRYLSE